MDILFAAASRGNTTQSHEGLSLMRRQSDAVLLRQSSSSAQVSPEKDVTTEGVTPKTQTVIVDAMETTDSRAESPVPLHITTDAEKPVAETGEAFTNPLSDDGVGRPNPTVFGTQDSSSSSSTSTATQAIVPPPEPPLPPPTSVISKDDIIGIREPRNTKRKTKLITMDSVKPPASSVGRQDLAYSCASVYKQFCSAYSTKPNSRVASILEQHDMHSQIPTNPFHDLTSLDASLCLLRDQGVLPLLEVIRLCVNLQSVNLADNELTNEGVEFLAHAVLEGTATTSFEVREEQEEQVAQSICGDMQPVYLNIKTTFCRSLASLDLSRNRFSLGGVRLLQLVADRLPDLVDLKVDGARVDTAEIELLDSILAENRRSQNP